MPLGVREQGGGQGAAHVPSGRAGAGGDSIAAQVPAALTGEGARAVTLGCCDSRGGISGERLPPGWGTPIPAHSPSRDPSFTLPYSGEDFHLEGRHFIYYCIFSGVIYGLPFI